MSDPTRPKDHPVAHLPSLFQRTLRTASAKGGLAFGEPSPLLPWLPAPRPVRDAGPRPPDAAAADKARQISPEPTAPAWLRLSVARDAVCNAEASSAFRLRAISHVGFGFGHLCPW